MIQNRAQQAAEQAARATEQAAKAAEQAAKAQVEAQAWQLMPKEGDANAAYQGLQRLRNELRSQLEVLGEQRKEISEQLQSPMLGGSDRTGLSKRIEGLDGRIALIDQQLAEVDAAIARSGSLADVRIDVSESVRPSVTNENEAALAIGALFILCVLLPISIAYARRIWRRSAAAVTSIPQDIAERLSRLDRNLDAVALEVERIGESQRFLTRSFAEQRGLSEGPAERVQVAARDKEWGKNS